MTIKALIFDVDGTLADTEDAHREAFNDAFFKAGFAWHWDRALYKDLLSVAGGKQRIRFFLEGYHRDVFARDDLEDLIANLHAVKTEFFVQRLKSGQVPLRPGIAPLIREAHARRVPLAIATTTTPLNVRTLLEVNLGAGVLEWFACIGDGAQVPVLKPAPDVYIWVLEKLGLDPQDTLALEDSHNGLAACTAAHVPCVIVTNAYSADQDFNGALAIRDTPAALTLAVLSAIHAKAGNMTTKP